MNAQRQLAYVVAAELDLRAEPAEHRRDQAAGRQRRGPDRDPPRPVRAVWVPAATMASDVGNRAAAPMPAMICPVHSTSTRVPVDEEAPGVSTAISSPTASSSAPPTSSRLRPNRSPSTPKVSSSRVTGTRKASEIQVSCEDVVPRSCWNSPLSTAGMARATWARQTPSAAATSVPVVSCRGASLSCVSVGGTSSGRHGKASGKNGTES